MSTYNKEEAIKKMIADGWSEQSANEMAPYLDAAFQAGQATRQIEHCAEPECPECNITAYKAGVEDCIAIVEECSDFSDSGHTLKMRIINQIQALK